MFVAGSSILRCREKGTDELGLQSAAEKSDMKNDFHYGNDSCMREKSVYFSIRIFRLVIIERFRRVTVLLVLIPAVARRRMETALSHLEIKWSGV